MPLLVNNRPIDEDLLNAEFSSIKSYFESLGNVSCCERDDEFRGYARENMVAKMLLAEEAERRIAAPTEEEVDQAVESIRQEQGDFQFHAMVALRPDGMEGVRKDAAATVRTERLLQQLWADIAEPSEDELRALYQEHLRAFMTVEEIRASHISKNPGKGESRDQVYEELCAVRRQLLAGGDFDALAREHSDKGKEQIDLGYFKRGEYPEEFEIVCFSMEVGELSPVFASTYGYHIAKLTDRKPAVAKPFDEVREFARQLWVEERRKAKTQALVEELKKTAVIEETAEEPAQA